jgi:cation:H+ antiporter
MITYILLSIIGIFLLSFGANYLVKSTLGLGIKLNINKAFLGIVVVGFGTSLPELLTSIDAAIKGYLSVSYGNIIGSNIFNVLFILGISIVVSHIKLKSVGKLDLIFLATSNIIFIILLFTIGINITSALILLMVIFLNIYFSYMSHKKSFSISVNKDEYYNKYWQILFFLVVGFAGLFFGSHLLVNNAIAIANIFNISEKIIGITIVAVGTSLPELFTSVVASLKKENDIAFYNILGSNIFNVTFIPGITGLITSFNQGIIFINDSFFYMLALACLLFIPLFFKNKPVHRSFGFFLLFSYFTYCMLLFYK